MAQQKTGARQKGNDFEQRQRRMCRKAKQTNDFGPKKVKIKQQLRDSREGDQRDRV